MTRGRQSVSIEPALARRGEAAVQGCAGPAWAIDIETGRLVAANAAGRARLGDAADGPALVLEPRVLATLTASAAEVDGADGTATCAVRFPGIATPIEGVLRLLTDRWPALALIEAAAPAPRDDTAILGEIARRIRAGLKTLTGRPGGTVSAPAKTPVPTKTAVGPAAEAAKPSPATPQEVAVTARAAHELKTPISAIAVAAEIMRDERFGPMGNERYREYAADIADNAHHALSVVDRMLGPRQSAAGDLEDEFHRRDLDVNDIVAGVVAALTPLAERNGLELTADLTPRLPPVSADATSLRQILVNLLANALRLTPPGGEIAVSTLRVPRNRAAIKVRDTGPGMTRSEIARVLARRDTTSGAQRPGGGLGLGLPLVAAFAKANGAHLEIDSVLEKGTTVGLTFAPASLDASERV